MDTVAALIIFSSFGAWISVRARAAGPALVFGLFGLSVRLVPGSTNGGVCTGQGVIPGTGR